MWNNSSWSVLWCKGILFHRHQNVISSPDSMDVSMKTCTTIWIANRITMHRFCHFDRSWSSSVWKIRRRLWQNVQLVSAKSRNKMCLLPEVLLVLSMPCSWRAAEGFGDNRGFGAVTIINQCSQAMLQDPVTTLPSLPREVVDDGKGCSVTVLSILKASLFVMLVLRSMWRRSPWIMFRLLPTRMTVVVRLILKNQKVRGIV